jgi:hypothetical protein
MHYRRPNSVYGNYNYIVMDDASGQLCFNTQSQLLDAISWYALVEQRDV